MLREFIGERKTGLLFCSKTSKPLRPSNILPALAAPCPQAIELEGPGEWVYNVRQSCVPSLPQYALAKLHVYSANSHQVLVGHAGQDMSDLYDKAKNDVQFRKEVAERAGLGFELPAEKSVVGPNGPKIENEVALEMAASV